MESRVQSPRGLDEGSTKLKFLPIYLNYRRYTTQPLLFFLSEFVRSDPQNCYYNQIFVNGAIDPFLKLCVVALPRVPTRPRSLLPSSVVTRISPATSNPCAPWLAPPPPGVQCSGPPPYPSTRPQPLPFPPAVPHGAASLRPASALFTG